MSTFTVLEKACSRCGEWKELNAKNFPPHTGLDLNGKPYGDGYGPWCRQCHRKYSTKRYKAMRRQQRLACQSPAN